MKFSDWTHDLFKLAAAPHPLAVALRVGVAVGVPLLGGLATGNVPAGVIAAACALLVTLADIGTTRAIRVGTMVAAGLAILGGGTVGPFLETALMPMRPLSSCPLLPPDGSALHTQVSRRWRAFVPSRLQLARVRSLPILKSYGLRLPALPSRLGARF
jgi:hypothetical protein